MRGGFIGEAGKTALHYKALCFMTKKALSWGCGPKPVLTIKHLKARTLFAEMRQ